MLHRILKGPAAPAGGRALVAVCLAAILAIALVLRFYALDRRGLLYWDEAKFALEGIRLQSYLLTLLGQHGDLASGKAVGTAKPTHALLLGMAYVLLGQRDVAALYAQAAASVVAVGLTFFLAVRLFDVVTGLLASLLLAVGSYDVIYARSALSESDATLLWLAALLFALARDGRMVRLAGTTRLCASGLLFGLAFTTNYRIAVYAATAATVFLVLALREHDRDRLIRVATAWVAGFLVPIATWQLAGLVSPGGLFRNEFTGAPTSYLSEVTYQLFGGKSAVRHFDMVRYLTWFVARQGPVALALLIIGLVIAGWKRTAAWLVPASLVVGPYLVYIWAPYIVPRNMVAALPLAAILEAAVIRSLGETVGWRRLAVGAAALLAIVVVILSVEESWQLTSVRSGFAAAAGFLERHGANRVLTSSEVALFYLRGKDAQCDAPALPVDRNALGAYVRSGYKYAILENAHDVTATTLFIEARALRVHQSSLYGPYRGESLVRSELGDSPLNRFSTREYVDVFLLSGLHLPRSALVPVQCNLNRVT